MQEIKRLENELLYQISGKKVAFEAEIKRIHISLATKHYSYILNAHCLMFSQLPLSGIV